MKFNATEIPGVFVVEAEPYADERGFFTRLYCPDEFVQAGIRFTPVQVNLSRNVRQHTLRGLHYQDPPCAEAKLVHVTRGCIHEVVVDVRPDSPSYGKWMAVELDAVSARAVFVPEGCAHGFLTLAADTDVLYHMGRLYEPGHAKGYRWNDPRLNIIWPAEPTVVAPTDRNWPDFPRANVGEAKLEL